MQMKDWRKHLSLRKRTVPAVSHTAPITRSDELVCTWLRPVRILPWMLQNADWAQRVIIVHYNAYV